MDQLGPVMRRGDLPGFARLRDALFERGQRMSPDQLTAAIAELAPLLARRPAGLFSQLALIAGAFVEWGGSPLALAENSTVCALMTMHLRLAFSQAWPTVAGDDPEPHPDDPPAMTDLIARFQGAASRLEITHEQAAVLAVAWFDVDDWINLMITLMARREFRETAPLLQDVGQVAEQLGASVRRAHWLPDLAAVLDDEPLVVIDHATGRGYRLTMSGIGDNYQLHTLLADRLIGDPAQGLLDGDRPEAAWVAAATTADPEVGANNMIERRFRLFDAVGAYISPDGKPAGITSVDGARAIVLHPPRGKYHWTTGRTYQHMIPTLTLDAIMTEDEAERWRAHLAPAREDDLFGVSNRPGP